MWPVLVSNPQPLVCEPEAVPLCHRGLQNQVEITTKFLWYFNFTAMDWKFTSMRRTLRRIRKFPPCYERVFRVTLVSQRTELILIHANVIMLKMGIQGIFIVIFFPFCRPLTTVFRRKPLKSNVGILRLLSHCSVFISIRFCWWKRCPFTLLRFQMNELWKR